MRDSFYETGCSCRSTIHWKNPRIGAHINDGEAMRENLEMHLQMKVASRASPNARTRAKVPHD